MLAFQAPLLLVAVEDPESELATALRDAPKTGGARIEPTMGFETLSSSQGAIDLRVKNARLARPPFTAAQVLLRLIRSHHAAAPLRKRAGAGKAFSERISVGRARNNDVVLRHESVSKFHAWLRRDDNDVFYVADAGSRNGSFVNGEAIEGGAPVALTAGDALRFGNVEAVLCPVELLWEALQVGS